MLFKARCARISHNKDQCAKDIKILSDALPNYKFIRNEEWYSDSPPNYPILVKDLNDISDEELERLFPIVDKIMIP